MSTIPGRPLSTGWLKHNIPTTDEIKALDGRLLATLTPEESRVLSVASIAGKSFGVAVALTSDSDPDVLAAARTPEEAGTIMKKADCRVSVTVSPATSSDIEQGDSPVDQEPVAYLRRDQLERIKLSGPMHGYISPYRMRGRDDLVAVYAGPQQMHPVPSPDVDVLVEALTAIKTNELDAQRAQDIAMEALAAFSVKDVKAEGVQVTYQGLPAGAQLYRTTQQGNES